MLKPKSPPPKPKSPPPKPKKAGEVVTLNAQDMVKYYILMIESRNDGRIGQTELYIPQNYLDLLDKNTWGPFIKKYGQRWYSNAHVWIPVYNSNDKYWMFVTINKFDTNITYVKVYDPIKRPNKSQTKINNLIKDFMNRFDKYIKIQFEWVKCPKASDKSYSSLYIIEFMRRIFNNELIGDKYDPVVLNEKYKYEIKNKKIVKYEFIERMHKKKK